jgi:hypothetical protein
VNVKTEPVESAPQDGIINRSDTSPIESKSNGTNKIKEETVELATPLPPVAQKQRPNFMPDLSNASSFHNIELPNHDITKISKSIVYDIYFNHTFRFD